MSRPCRDALGAVMLLSRHCALGGLYRVMHIASLSGRLRGCYVAITALRPVGLYRVMHIASLSGRPIGCHADILTRPDRDETLHITVQEDEVLAVP